MTPPSLRGSLLMAVLVAGCESPPDHPVFVYGWAQRADGSSLSNSTLHFDRRENLPGPDAAEASAVFMPYKAVTTTADGAFTLELPAQDVEAQPPEGFRAYRFRGCTPPEEGPVAIASFTFNAQDVELPHLRPWNAELIVTGSSAGPVVTFAPPPPAPEKPPSAKLPVFFDSHGAPQLTAPTTPEPIVQLTSGQGLLWQEPRDSGAWMPTAWVLEDFAAPQVQVRALSIGEWEFEPLWGGTSQVTFRLEWRSTREPLPRGTLQALSRGAMCAPWWGPGPCPWTDGQLDSVLLGDKRQDPLEIGLIFPVPVRLSRAVLRGLQAEGGFSPDQTLLIEGGKNDSDWTPLAVIPLSRSGALEPRAPFASLGRLWAADSPLDGPLVLNGAPLFLDIPLKSNARVRQVRLSVTNPDGHRRVLHSLAEFSLFE